MKPKRPPSGLATRQNYHKPAGFVECAGCEGIAVRVVELFGAPRPLCADCLKARQNRCWVRGCPLPATAQLLNPAGPGLPACAAHAAADAERVRGKGAYLERSALEQCPGCFAPRRDDDDCRACGRGHRL